MVFVKMKGYNKLKKGLVRRVDQKGKSMIRLDKKELSLVKDLFQDIEDSMAIACLQGYMGEAYVKSKIAPKAALIISGEYSFFGGDPNSEEAMHLVEHFFQVCSGESSVAIFSDGEPDWEKTLLAYKENNPISVPRFGIVQRDYDFDLKQLSKFVKACPAPFEIVAFDEVLYHQAMSETWSREFCETFPSAEAYLERGFGFAAVEKGKLVSGASSMSVYDGGIEIQVATKEDYQQKGLALPCAAALILECVKRGVRPCWDGATLISKHMALKLGYEYKGEYTTVHLRRAGNTAS